MDRVIVVGEEIAVKVGEFAFSLEDVERVGFTADFSVGDLVTVQTDRAKTTHLLVLSDKEVFTIGGRTKIRDIKDNYRLVMKTPFSMVDNTTLQMIFGENRLEMYELVTYKRYMELRKRLKEIESEIGKLHREKNNIDYELAGLKTVDGFCAFWFNN